MGKEGRGGGLGGGAAGVAKSLLLAEKKLIKN